MKNNFVRFICFASISYMGMEHCESCYVQTVGEYQSPTWVWNWMEYNWRLVEQLVSISYMGMEHI